MSARLQPLPPAWLATLQAQLVQPPARPRVGLWWQDGEFGSVEPGFVERVHATAPAMRALLRPFAHGFRIEANVTGGGRRVATQCFSEGDEEDVEL